MEAKVRGAGGRRKGLGPAAGPSSSSSRRRSHAPSQGGPAAGAPLPSPGNLLAPVRRPFSTSPPPLLLLLLGVLVLGFVGVEAEGKPSENSAYGDGSAQNNWRITCYTCVNVSNNDECNRFAIDRPCPEGGDYCLTLHVMDALDRERSVLVNKRCASLDDCTGDSTGCATAYGQTQCVSCCDQPYCNDSAPSNSTNAVFYRSSASALGVEDWRWNAVAWRAFALLIPTLKLLTFDWPS